MNRMTAALNDLPPYEDRSRSAPARERSETRLRAAVQPSEIRVRLHRLERLGKWAVWACDLLAASLAWEGALAFRGSLGGLGPLLPVAPLAPLLFLLVYGVALYGNGCYTRGRPSWIFPRMLKAAGFTLLLFLAASYLLHWFHISRAFLALLSASLLLAVGAEWLLIRAVQRGLRRFGVGYRRVLVAGTVRSSVWVLHDLCHSVASGVRLLGLVTDESEPKLPADTPEVRVFRGTSRIARLAARTHAEEVVLCLPDWPAERLVMLLQELWPLGVRVHLLSPDLSVYLRRAEVPPGAFHGLALLDFGRAPMRGGLPLWKRSMDLVCSLFLIVLFAPFHLLICLALWLTEGRPILYSQERCAGAGRRFRIWKFRTMHVNADELKGELLEANDATGPLFKIRDDPRVTRLGALLRRHSLDELPQLLNVLKGEMSLVGPRPPLPGEVANYEPWHHARLAGVVGGTGLWQVSGRSDLPFEEMAMLDIYYLHNMSPRLDAKILIRTVWAVLAGKGAY